MRPRDPKKAETIRTKAVEMLVVEGVDGFSMQKLARAAGVSPATLYIHFKDKEDLLYQLWAEQAQALTDTFLDGFDPHAPFAVGLWVQWQNRVRFYREHQLAWRFLEQVRHSSLMGKYVDRANIPFFEAMGTFITASIARGELTDLGMGQAPDFPKGVFWALAFAPLYELLRREAETRVTLDDRTLKLTFDRVLLSLKA
jgi:TetR/AcrR family transcriptional regulator, multidrug resistance operon repressor